MLLLLLALPLQGLAASTMLLCAGARHGVGAVSGAGNDAGHDAGHHPRHHPGDDAGTDDQTSSTQHAYPTQQHLHQHAMDGSHTAQHADRADAARPPHDLPGKCSVRSACSACCAVAVLPDLTLVVAAVTSRGTAPAFAPRPLVHCATDGPDRPPRTTLA